MSPRQRTSLFLDEALVAGLQKLKERDGVPYAEAVRRAVAEYLKQRGIEVVEPKAARKRVATRKRA